MTFHSCYLCARAGLTAPAGPDGLCTPCRDRQQAPAPARPAAGPAQKERTRDGYQRARAEFIRLREHEDLTVEQAGTRAGVCSQTAAAYEESRLAATGELRDEGPVSAAPGRCGVCLYRLDSAAHRAACKVKAPVAAPGGEP